MAGRDVNSAGEPENTNARCVLTVLDEDRVLYWWHCQTLPGSAAVHDMAR